MTMQGWAHKEATTGRKRLRIGIGGPSRSGKTYSALRTATGMIEVLGGEIFLIDTDNDFALDYAYDPKTKTGFKFQHVDFQPPFTSERYKESVEYCISQNASVIIVDHMTHEHTGDGGMIERQEKLATELAIKWKTTREKTTWAAWAQAKDPHSKFVSYITRVKQPMIFCFRAKDKLKLFKNSEGKQEAVHMGFTPICVEQFDYEMSAMLILPPNSDGKTDKGQSEIRESLRKIIRLEEQIDEGMGKRLAEWAKGGIANPQDAPQSTNPEPSGNLPPESGKKDYTTLKAKEGYDRGMAVKGDSLKCGKKVAPKTDCNTGCPFTGECEAWN